MSLLTDREINSIAYDDDTSRGPVTFARAVEAAVIKKLVTVSVEATAWAMQRPDGMVLDVIDNSEHNRHAGEYNLALYTAEAVAAARVQALGRRGEDLRYRERLCHMGRCATDQGANCYTIIL